MNARKHQLLHFFGNHIRLCVHVCVYIYNFFFFGEELVCIFVYKEKGMQWLILNSLNH